MGEQGNAQFNYEEGVSFLKRQNFVQAAHHFKLAIDKDHPEAIKAVSHYRELQARVASLYVTGDVGEKKFRKASEYYNLAIRGTSLEGCVGKMPAMVYVKFLKSVDFYELFSVLIDQNDHMTPEQLLMFLSEKLSLDLEQARKRDAFISSAKDAIAMGDLDQRREAEARLHSLVEEEPDISVDTFLSYVSSKDLIGRPCRDIQMFAFHAKRALDSGARDDLSMRGAQQGFDEYQSMLLEIGSLYARGVGEKSMQKAFRYFNEALVGGHLSKVWLILPYDLKVRVMQTFRLSDAYLSMALTNRLNIFELMLYLLRQADIDVNEPQYEWIQGFNRDNKQEYDVYVI